MLNCGEGSLFSRGTRVLEGGAIRRLASKAEIGKKLLEKKNPQREKEGGVVARKVEEDEPGKGAVVQKWAAEKGEGRS